MTAGRRRWAGALFAAAGVLLLPACGPGPAAPDGEPSTTAPSGTPSVPAPPAPDPAPTDLTAVVAADLAELETAYDARVGVYAVDTATGDLVEHRADERFAYASTIKALAAGFVLRGRSVEVLDEPVPVTTDDVSGAGWSPATESRVGTDATVRELGAAAVSESDNGAFNALLRRLGGPEALQAALVDLGDTTTLVDAWEPELNRFTPGEPARTSTPRALADGLAAFALGDELEPGVREEYVGWLTGSTTGDGTVRAGAPDGWVVGSKTGTAGRHGSRNDVAVVWPPDGAPIVLAVLTDRVAPDAEPDDALLADVARTVLGAYADQG
ncbi:class A beta-lactamase [Cellulosimicrobium sp. Marseille-Q4280]|uniref:class A beta-lactamase n=1 Tax=Cellulosimicrobium sp. Marseille-Q4280 TaxID=2937992 RepID=UPI00203C6D4E|nr:class A beta-lactamase [Cellulosimicrobium sp. Marseille-Q4280]